MQDKENVSGSTFFQVSELPSIVPTFESHPDLSRRVLIFSGESDTRILLKTILEIWGYAPETSDSIEKSLLLIESFEPHLIVLDSVLPFEMHLDNIRRLRRHNSSKEIPIIVISGFSQTRFENLSIAVGADDFLVKPLDFDLLEGCLARIIEKTAEKIQ